MRILREHEMTVLLAALLVLLVGSPVANRFDLVGLRFVLDAVFMVVMLAALRAEQHRIAWKRPGLYAVLLAVSLRFIGTSWESTLASDGYRTFLVLSELYIAAVLFHICYALLRNVIVRRQVTFNMVAGVSATYVLIAIAFASVHIAVFVGEPEPAYAGPAIERDGSANVASVQQALAPSFTYYSVVTQTTLGYGDITPKTDIARGLTMVQTIIGQLFLAIILARIVAIQLSQEQFDRPD